MNERRKIIIPTGGGPNEPLPTPNFDTESTLTARPVVPLSEQETSHLHYGGYQGNVEKPFWKRPGLIALIIGVAVAAGVAAGFGISLYRNRQATTAPIANSPDSADENSNPRPIAEQSPPVQTPAALPRETPDPRSDQEDEERASAADKEPDDDDTTPVVRTRKPETTDDESDAEFEERRAERERKREERRERRRRQREEEETVDIPRRIDRAGREINGRIREIFEGRQP